MSQLGTTGILRMIYALDVCIERRENNMGPFLSLGRRSHRRDLWWLRESGVVLRCEEKPGCRLGGRLSGHCPVITRLVLMQAQPSPELLPCPLEPFGRDSQLVDRHPKVFLPAERLCDQGRSALGRGRCCVKSSEGIKILKANPKRGVNFGLSETRALKLEPGSDNDSHNDVPFGAGQTMQGRLPSTQ